MRKPQLSDTLPDVYPDEPPVVVAIVRDLLTVMQACCLAPEHLQTEAKEMFASMGLALQIAMRRINGGQSPEDADNCIELAEKFSSWTCGAAKRTEVVQ